MKTLLFIGSVYNLGFGLFHLCFWKIFRWKEDLAKLGGLNRAIVPVLNIHLTYVLFVFAFLSAVYPESLLQYSLGRAVLGGISLFWFGRAVNQILFFQFQNLVSKIMFAIFLAGGLIYLIPALGG
jgi:hypothetical protein